MKIIFGGWRTGNRFFELFYYRSFLRIKLFGITIEIADGNKNPPLYGERIGYRKWCYLGKWKTSGIHYTGGRGKALTMDDLFNAILQNKKEPQPKESL